MNLATNARDAMPDGGVLTIDTAAIPVPNPPVDRLSAGRAAGTYVRLAVTDTGTGMDAAIQARLFEPFFSTKAWGRGTGLGLSILDSIVTSLGGWITVMSAPGQGSTFEVYLPASEAVVRPSEPAARDALDVGRETILVVDDDPGVLALVSAILVRHGYHVLTADAPAAAITRVAAAAAAVSLVITDVVMPGLTGPRLMARLRPLGCTRVVYMSGHPTPDLGVWAPEEHVGFLAKPFTPRNLLACVRRALEDA